MRNPIIAALDVPTAEQALKLAEEIASWTGDLKLFFRQKKIWRNDARSTFKKNLLK